MQRGTVTPEFMYATYIIQQIQNINEQIKSTTSKAERTRLVNKINQLSYIIKDVVITYHDNGRVKKEEWCKGDYVYHRPGNAPAVVEYFESGKIRYEAWYVDDRCHRAGGGPAYILYFENGQIQEKKWIEDGKLHRVDAPVVITYFEDGSIKERKYKD